MDMWCWHMTDTRLQFAFDDDEEENYVTHGFLQ
jgi:hypothetical protein